MYRTYFLLIFFITFQVNEVFSQETEYQSSLFDENALLKHIKSLSSDAFEGRRTGTYGAAKARKYIVNQFHALKVEPLGESFKQSFSFIEKRKNF